MPSASPLKKSYYSADQSLSLSQLDVEKISQVVRDLDVAESEKEHYVTGWMGQNSVVLVRNYQDKRGTSNGIVMSRGNRYKLTIQAITFRIPKFLLWITFRRKPRTMTVIAYNKLGEQATGLQQFMHIQEPELKEQLESDWRELNDYLGMACWQMENNQPLWRKLREEITPQSLLMQAESAWFSGKKLQKDGECEGLWLHEQFIGRRTGEHAALLLSWKDEENQDIASYRFERVSATKIRVMLRPRKEAKFYPLNPFDAVHLQQALTMYHQAEEALSETQRRA
ncbi:MULTISPECIES: hypothetical protein [Rahnella]|jgi:hypothetical protein|uniref:hypothetical protein n=1 Tax=Rahnella TaxID=34037 RepID=UPI001265E323|nr:MULTISPECIES: hypothetical protein [unclassified Rahnella]KAB8311293.1 hypothetical protein EH227_05390 [Rouxiella chamberiensis]MBU9821538.1 hypothetical protein [Rahnella sp. BCC 1045]MCS3423259.1 hypothetical protein [Rahnella sp. BIGb0603]